MSAWGLGGLLLGRSPALPAQGNGSRQLVIGVGRDFFDGPDSRTFLHGSTHTWEGLTYLDEQLRAVPWLAESWSMTKAGRKWHFQIRPGVHFHDGSPLTTREIIASLNRIKGNPKYDPTGIYRNVQKLEAGKPRELIFHLKAPSPAFPNLMAYYSSPVIKPACFESQGRITGLVATGPFQVVRIRRGESITLRAFPDYWGVKPFFQEILFKTIVDAQSRIMALMTGEVDAVADVGGILPEQVHQLTKDPHIVIKHQEVATTHYLFFNCRRPPFSKKTTRLWLAGLMEGQIWIKALTQGFSRPAGDFYTPLARDWAFGLVHPSTGEKPSRPGRVLTLLIHSGTIQRWPYLELAQLLQERLNREGLSTRIQVIEAGPFQEALKKLDFDLVLQPNTLMTGDPDFFYSYYIYSQGPHNFGYHNQESDRLILEARQEMNKQRRRRLYRDLARLINTDLPVFPLYHDLSIYAHRKTIERFELDQNFRPDLIRAGRRSS
ncbi:MAG: ABC transporter substrate-binding protein [Pseudomonadota bacterium]